MDGDKIVRVLYLFSMLLGLWNLWKRKKGDE